MGEEALSFALEAFIDLGSRSPWLQERTILALSTVLITDTGSLVEYTKAIGITRSKELGKMTL